VKRRAAEAVFINNLQNEKSLACILRGPLFMIVIGAVDFDGKREHARTSKPFSKEHCLYGGFAWIGDEVNGSPQLRMLEGYVSPISTNGTEGEWSSHIGES